MIVEQVTRERLRQACAGPECGAVVVHIQIAGYPAGVKTYQWIPIAHTRPDGSRCSHLSRERSAVWNLQHPKP